MKSKFTEPNQGIDGILNYICSYTLGKHKLYMLEQEENTMEFMKVVFNKQPDPNHLHMGDILSVWDVARNKLIGLSTLSIYYRQANDKELKDLLEDGIKFILSRHIDKIQKLLKDKGYEFPRGQSWERKLDENTPFIIPNTMIDDEHIAMSLREISRLTLSLEAEGLRNKLIGLPTLSIYYRQANDKELKDLLEDGIKFILSRHIDKIQKLLKDKGYDFPSGQSWEMKLDENTPFIIPNTMIDDERIAMSLREIIRLTLSLEAEGLRNTTDKNIRGLLTDILEDNNRGLAAILALQRKKQWKDFPPTILS
jgi:hypothetical protein